MILKHLVLPAIVLALVVFGVLGSSTSSAQDTEKLAKPIFIQAQAMGQVQQLGRNFSVDIRIERFSSAADQKVLLEAFQTKKNEGLVNALSRMSSKGRMSVTGTLGFEIHYAREWPMPGGGRRIRVVTDRPINFAEAWTDSRSSDYSLSGAEIILSADRKNNSGTLYPAAELKMNKEGQIELELYRNEWKLVNVRRR